MTLDIKDSESQNSKTRENQNDKTEPSINDETNMEEVVIDETTTNLPVIPYTSQIREVLNELKNIFYDIEDDREETKEIHETLLDVLAKAKKLQKKEDGLPIRVEKEKCKKKFRNLPPRKRKTATGRIGERAEKLKKASDIKISSNSQKKVEIIEEHVIDDNRNYEMPEFDDYVNVLSPEEVHVFFFLRNTLLRNMRLRMPKN